MISKETREDLALAKYLVLSSFRVTRWWCLLAIANLRDIVRPGRSIHLGSTSHRSYLLRQCRRSNPYPCSLSSFTSLPFLLPLLRLMMTAMTIASVSFTIRSSSEYSKIRSHKATLGAFRDGATRLQTSRHSLRSTPRRVITNALEPDNLDILVAGGGGVAMDVCKELKVILVEMCSRMKLLSISTAIPCVKV